MSLKDWINTFFQSLFTPNIDFDNMKSLGNLSAKAIRKVMLLAVIKAERHKEKHDDYMKRHANLMIAILGNVLDYRHKAEYDALLLRHEFQEPFGEDVSELLADLSKQYNDGALSRETYVELSYLVKDAKQEIERLKTRRSGTDGATNGVKTKWTFSEGLNNGNKDKIQCWG